MQVQPVPFWTDPARRNHCVPDFWWTGTQSPFRSGFDLSIETIPCKYSFFHAPSSGQTAVVLLANEAPVDTEEKAAEVEQKKEEKADANAASVPPEELQPAEEQADKVSQVFCNEGIKQALSNSFVLSCKSIHFPFSQPNPQLRRSL